MNTLTKSFVAATLTLAGFAANAAQGELYQFNDGPAAPVVANQIAASNTVDYRVGEQGVVAAAPATTADRATVKAMILDAGGLLLIPRA
jgi:hypothetical protein